MEQGSACLRLPAQRALVGVARLTVAGIAGRLGFDIDAAEDIKLAVAEAVNLLLRGQDGGPDDAVEIGCAWTADSLAVEVRRDGVPPPLDMEESHVAVMVLEAVMDEVETVELAGPAPRVRLRRQRPGR